MSWHQLTAIIQEAWDIDAAEALKLPVDCPICGTPLIAVDGTILHCPSDGWQYPRDA